MRAAFGAMSVRENRPPRRRCRRCVAAGVHAQEDATDAAGALRAGLAPVRISDSISVRASASLQRELRLERARVRFVAAGARASRGRAAARVRRGRRRGSARAAPGRAGVRREGTSEGSEGTSVGSVSSVGSVMSVRSVSSAGPFRPAVRAGARRRERIRKLGPLSVPPRVGRWGRGCAPFDTPGMNGEAPSDMTAGPPCRAGDRVRHAGDERGGALDGERAVKAARGARLPDVDGAADAACPVEPRRPSRDQAPPRPRAPRFRGASVGGIVPEGGRRSRGAPAEVTRGTGRPRRPRAKRRDATMCDRARAPASESRSRASLRAGRGVACSRRRSTTRRRCRRP